MIRVVIVDDEPLIRRGVSGALRNAPDLEVTAAVPVSEAVDAISETRPRVVLLDACTTDADRLSDGFRAVPGPPSVCVLSRSADREHIAVALAAGASGYIMKSTAPQVLVPLVRCLAEGWTVMSPDAGRALARPFLVDRQRAATASQTDSLTPREYEILALLATGLPNTAIAARLHLAAGTVKDHVSAVLGKLGVRSRLQAAVLADRAGIVPDDLTER